MAFTRSVFNNEDMITGGCYQQYVIADALNCLKLPDDIPFDVGSMHFVNPLTAIGLVEKIKLLGGRAAV